MSECPLTDEQLNALLGNTPNMVLEWSKDGSKTLVDLLRQAAIEGYQRAKQEAALDAMVAENQRLGLYDEPK